MKHYWYQHVFTSSGERRCLWSYSLTTYKALVSNVLFFFFLADSSLDLITSQQLSGAWISNLWQHSSSQKLSPKMGKQFILSLTSNDIIQRAIYTFCSAEEHFKIQQFKLVSQHLFSLKCWFLLLENLKQINEVK